MSFEAGEIVYLPFPFTDRASNKHRPALVLSIKSFNDKHKHLVLAMVTSAKNAPCPSDVPIVDLKTAGLPNPSVIRMKVFTLDERLILGVLGKLSSHDKRSFLKQMGANLGIAPQGA